MKPNLVLIEGNLATRYVDGEIVQTVQIDFEGNQTIEEIEQDIEYYRENGVKVID